MLTGSYNADAVIMSNKDIKTDNFRQAIPGHWHII